MAKLGEGDDRWIVADRADGANVHGWHWQEKDCLAWTQERFGELLAGKGFAADALECRITKVSSCTGEAFVNIRKGKMIPSYEVEMRLAWEGTVRDGSDNVIASASGQVHLPYIAEENSDEDPEVKVSVSADNAASARLRELMLAEGKPAVCAAVAQWVKEMAGGGPGGSGAAPKPEPKPAQAAATAQAEEKAADADKPKAPLKSWEIDRRKITMKTKFFCSAGDIYEALTDPRRMMGFSMAPAESSPEEGGAFMMYGGSLHGTYEELVPPNRIVQKWRFSSWEDGVFSKVVIAIEETEPGNTVVKLVQTGLPESDKYGNEDVYDTTEKGWKVRGWAPCPRVRA